MSHQKVWLDPGCCVSELQLRYEWVLFARRFDESTTSPMGM